MSSIYVDDKSGKYLISFRFGGKQFRKGLLTDDETKAKGLQATVDETLLDIKRGKLTLPADADFWTFVFSGGKLAQAATAANPLTLEELFTRYEELLPAGHHEDNTRDTYRLHKKHLLRLLGSKRPAQTLTLTDLQEYANKRAKERYRGRKTRPATIKKEVATLRAVWNESVRHKLVTGPAPVKGLKYEKADEPRRFMTWEEIEQEIAGQRLTEEQTAELWECLFLNKKQITEVLDHVKSHAREPFIHPMFVFAAYTGARRSEMIRCLVGDIDFRTGYVTLREKKRDRSVKHSTRRVPMAEPLRQALTDWFAVHPGGPYLFRKADIVPRSKKRSLTTGHQSPNCRPTSLKGRMSTVVERTDKPAPEPLTRKEAHDALRKTLEGGKWSVLHGWHMFRHSFASNLADEGVTERVIDKLMGHQTEAMRKRYQHLFKDKLEDAVKKLCG